MVAAGWLLAKSQWLKPKWLDVANDLTAKILLPVLLFLGSYRYGQPDDVPLTLLAAFYFPMLIIFVALMWLLNKQTNKSPFALCAVYSNNVFLGIPIVSQVVGDAGIRYAFMVIAFHSLLAFSLYYVASSHSLKRSRWQPIINTFKNPIVMSLVLGLSLNKIGLELPQWLLNGLGLISEVALPGALLVLGASLARLRLSNFWQGLLISSIKLIALPCLVYLLSKFVFGLANEITLVLIIFSGCPVGISAYPVVINDGRDGSLVSSAILLSSLGCVVTLPIWLLLLG